jgi:hypothetical protein
MQSLSQIAGSREVLAYKSLFWNMVPMKENGDRED